MKDELCQECNKNKKSSNHANARYCLDCKNKFLSKPKGTLTQKQIQYAKRYAGKKNIVDIAKDLGVSKSNIKRSIPGLSFCYLYKYKKNPALVLAVSNYYSKHGRRKTEKKFGKEINVRSIVEHYQMHSARQVRLTNDNYKELLRMAGLITMEAQARFLNRPGAHRGSIRSFWQKCILSKNSNGQTDVNGLRYHKVKHLVNKTWNPKEKNYILHCPFVDILFFKQERNHNNKIYLWIDLEKNLKDTIPSFVKEAVRTQAIFQKWIWQDNNPREKILDMIKTREDFGNNK
jgi:DNA-binding MarR family transcriptional regulator